MQGETDKFVLILFSYIIPNLMVLCKKFDFDNEKEKYLYCKIYFLNEEN